MGTRGQESQYWQGDRRIHLKGNSVMIDGCKKRGDCWTRTTSPGFVQRQRLRGYWGTPKQGLSGLSGAKKNGMWMLWKDAPELLRPEGTADSGPFLRGHAGISGGGCPEGSVPGVREGEAGEVSVAFGQPLLHEALFLLGGAGTPRSEM